MLPTQPTIDLSHDGTQVATMVKLLPQHVNECAEPAATFIRMQAMIAADSAQLSLQYRQGKSEAATRLVSYIIVIANSEV